MSVEGKMRSIGFRFDTSDYVVREFRVRRSKTLALLHHQSCHVRTTDTRGTQTYEVAWPHARVVEQGLDIDEVRGLVSIRSQRWLYSPGAEGGWNRSHRGAAERRITSALARLAALGAIDGSDQDLPGSICATGDTVPRVRVATEPRVRGKEELRLFDLI